MHAGIGDVALDVHTADQRGSANICQVLERRADDEPDRVGFVFLRRRGAEAETLTYGALRSRVRRIAAALETLAPAGTMVACLLPAGPDFLAGFFGTLWAGMVAAPVMPLTQAQDGSALLHILEHCGARVIISTTEIRDRSPSSPAGVRWLLLDQPMTTAECVDPAGANNDLAYLQYTSGSTGRPKGVMITHRNIIENSEHIRRRFRHQRSSVGVIWLPPHHDMGLVGGVIQPLYAGFPVYLMPPQEFIRSPGTWLKAISKYGGTTSGGPNFAFEACVARITPEARAELDLSTWDIAFTGAEPISQDTLRRFTDAFAPFGFRSEAWFPCYGLGEATLMVSGGGESSGSDGYPRPNDDNAGRSIACGAAIDDHEVVIVDVETSAPVAPGLIGEIWVSGPSVAAGYWGDAAATRAAFEARLPGHSRTYLRTGDLGYIGHGGVHVCGRLKSCIIIRGVNHQLEDIERTVGASHPVLAGRGTAACVVGAFAEPELAIMQEIGRAASGSAADIEDTIRAAVVRAHGVTPAFIRLVPPGSLPRTTSGKVRRQEWAAYLNGGADPARDAS